MIEGADLLAYLFQLLRWTILPWGLGALAVAGALSLTPFGSDLIAYLRSRRRDTEMLEAVLEELAGVRSALVEVAERLDAADQRLLRNGAPPPPPRHDDQRSVGESAVTPR
jgi:hypothetical protein